MSATKALLFRGKHSLEMASHVNVPEARSGWVVVRLLAAGVCGTDLEIVRTGEGCQPGLILGHEAVGQVVAVGPDVDRSLTGQVVAFEPSWPCGSCDECRGGWPQYCTRPVALGRTCNGAFAEYVAVPISTLHTVPDGVDPVDAQSVTTVASVLRGLARAGDILAGARVLVVGAGHVGLLAVQLARQRGAGEVTIVDIVEARLELGVMLGADRAVRPGSEAAGTFDVVIEASGASAGVDSALRDVRKGGTVVQLGICKHAVPAFVPAVLYTKELTVVGSRGGHGYFDEGLRLIADGRVRVRPLVGPIVPLADSRRAILSAAVGESAAIRTVIVPG